MAIDEDATRGRSPEQRADEALAHVVTATAALSAAAAERLRWISRLHREMADAAEYSSRMSRDLVDRSVRLELAAALRITERTAETLMVRADTLVRRYPEALTALAEGRITERHADLFTDAMDDLTPEDRADVAERALSRGEELATGDYRRWLRALVESRTAPTLTERHDEAVARRAVTVTTERDGMGTLSVYGPAVEVHAVYDRLSRMSRALGVPEHETRTRDQLRADALFDLLLEGEVAAHPGEVRGIRAEVIVTVPVLSLLDDDAAAHAPATIDGLGPIPIGRARELCGGAKSWMRVLTHPETSVVLSVGRKTYRPPAALARLVTWRAARCLAPGCAMPAGRCDIDHSIEWVRGGSTSAWNLDPLCKGHHVVRHHGGWTIRQLEGGVIEWTSPLGRVYLVEPERPTPGFRPDPVAPPPVARELTPAPF